jgi:beta-glucanase (GH16 family)
MLVLIALAMTQSQGLSGSSDTTPVIQKFDASKWTLEWRDEFNSGEIPDPRRWDYEEGFVRNNEAQFYTRGRKENARIEGGKLVIEGRQDNWNGKKITSASVVTKGRKEFLYGRIEARAKIPTGKGTWPAIWTLGTNIDKVGWPKCGELDILENVGFDPDKVHANVHVDAFNHMKGNGKGNNIQVKAPYTEFNVYAIEWFKDRIDFFFNDTRYLSYRKQAGWSEAEWPFDKPQYLILNLAIGGAWGGQQGIDDTKFPHRFEIDYVRYYVAK